MSKPYCGAKRPVPTGKTLGDPNVCFKKGIAVGAMMSEPKVRRAKISGIMEGSIAQRKATSKSVKKRGFAGMKRDVDLSSLNKDELRSIAVRLTGTANAITGYSSMSKERLAQELRRRGYS